MENHAVRKGQPAYLRATILPKLGATESGHVYGILPTGKSAFLSGSKRCDIPYRRGINSHRLLQFGTLLATIAPLIVHRRQSGRHLGNCRLLIIFWRIEIPDRRSAGSSRSFVNIRVHAGVLEHRYRGVECNYLCFTQSICTS